MSSTLQELRAYIKASGFESPAPNHASISAYIETNIIKDPNSLFKRHVPPLDIILYAIRRLLEPPDAPRLRDVPDLLDFLTTIEFYRKLALQRVDEALRIHRYYRGNGDEDDRTTLTDEDVQRLDDYQTAGPTQRTIYIELILQYCQWDIYNLWTSNPPCPTDATLRLCEYFPELNEYYMNSGAKSRRLFHNDLSEEEGQTLRERGIDSCTFIANSCDWAEERQRQHPGQTIATMFQTPEFADRFPCSIKLPNLRETMEYYLTAVEKMVNELHEMFPPE